MAYEIIWLPKAEERFAEIIDYLEHNWSDKVIEHFIKKQIKNLLKLKSGHQCPEGLQKWTFMKY